MAVIVATSPSASFMASLESALSCSSGRTRARRPPRNITPTRITNKRKPICDDEVALVHQFITFAIEQDAPIPWYALLRWVLRSDACGAVGGNGVIPTRFVPQSVERMDVFEETFACVRRRNGCAVKI